MLTNAQKQSIRQHWAPYILKFKKDGTVLAKKSPSGAYGLLYTKQDLERHITCLN